MNKTFKTLVVLLSIAGLMVATGCKKNAASGKVKQVVTTTNGTSTTTTNTYDSQGRLIARSGGLSISYSSNTVTVTNTTGTPTVYTLASSGLALTSNAGSTFTYDNNNFLISQVVNDGSTYNNTISNGDVVSSTAHELTQTGFANTTTTYTYLSNVDVRDYGVSFLGRNSTHAINSEIVTSGGNSVTYTHSYNFDGDGRVLTENVTGSNGYNSASTYTY